jgi:5-hydroxytryptamine receptor 1
MIVILQPSRLPGVSTLRVILASVDYSILLLCLLLAALNRFLDIARYEWYKKKVTNCGVIVLISNTSSLAFVIIIQSVLDWILIRLHLLHQLGSHALGPGLEFVAGPRLSRSLILKIFMESKTLMHRFRTNHRQSESLTVKFLNISSRNKAADLFGNDRLFLHHSNCAGNVKQRTERTK